MKLDKIIWIFALLALSSFVWAEEEEGDDVFEMDLGAILDIEVVSASKSAESIFDAPLSISAVTRKEIVNSGATSMPDVLRLVPGLIVREYTNGQFDVHIRGLDGVPPNTLLSFNSNQISLVMIDGRPVYNYYAGGTFWEALPISLNDIERVEVVRGPSAAMYGPNAASGVIHFLTRKRNEDGLTAEVKVKTGSLSTTVIDLSAGYKTDEYSTTISFNANERDRNDAFYYEISNQRYRELDTDFESVFQTAQGDRIFERYPNPDLAADNSGFNIFANFKLSETDTLEASLGAQDSEVQKVFVDAGTSPYTTAVSETTYLNLISKNGGLTTQFAYVEGEQNVLGAYREEVINGQTVEVETQLYDLETIDFVTEYDFKLMDNKLGIRPGLGYRSAEYDARFIGGAQTIEAMALMTRFDYKPNDALRLIAAIRLDDYDIAGRTADSQELSYQAIATYKPAEDMIYRAVYGVASKAPFMLDLFFDDQGASGTNRQFGNLNLELLQYDMFELGMRMKFAGNMELDLEAWSSETTDYADIYVETFLPPAGPPPAGPTITARYQNLGVSAQQRGISANLRIAFSEQLLAKFFLTLQETDIENFVGSQNDLEDPANPTWAALQAILPPPVYAGIIAEIQANYDENAVPVNIDGWGQTPDWYGGFALDYKVSDQLNVHVDSYFFDKHFIDRTIEPGGGSLRGSFLGGPNIQFVPNRIQFDVDRKFIINTKVNYAVSDVFDVHFTGRNITNDESVEYFGTDLIGSSWLVGFDYKFK